MTAIVERVVFQADTGGANAAIRDVNVNLRRVAREAADSQRSLGGLTAGLTGVEHGLRGLGKVAREAGLKGTVAEDAAGLTEELLGLATTFPAVGFGAIAAGAGVLAYAKAASQASETSIKLEKSLRAAREAYAGYIEKLRGSNDQPNLVEGQRQDYDRLTNERGIIRAEIKRLEAQRREQEEALQAADSPLRGLPGQAGERFRANARQAARALQETDDALEAERARLAALDQQGASIVRNTAYYTEQNRRRIEGEALLADNIRQREAAQKAAEQARAEAARKAAQEEQRYAETYKALVTDPQIAAATKANAEWLGVEAGLLTRLSALTDAHREAVLRNDQAKIAGLTQAIALTQREIELQAEKTAAERDRQLHPGVSVPQGNMFARVGPNGENGGIFQELNKAHFADDQAASIGALTSQVDGLAIAWDTATAAQYEAANAAQAYGADAIALSDVLHAGYETTKLVVSGFGQLGAGIVTSLEQSVTGQVKFGKAMAQVTKGILLGIAQEAAARALMATAQGIVYSFTPGLQGFAAGQFAAAGVYTAVATAFGAGGLALAAANRETGGSANAGPQRSANTVASSQANNAPSKVQIELKIADALYDPASIAKSFSRGIQAFNERSAFA